MIKFHIICDCREQFESQFDGEKIYNDHISKTSLQRLLDAFSQCGYNAEHFGGVQTLIDCYANKMSMPDGIYVNLNDGLSEKHKRGQTPLLLEMLDVKYTGCDAFQALLASDKFFTKLALKHIGITTANSVLIQKETDINKLEQLAYPVIVKPNYEGSSIGIDDTSFCADCESAARQIKKLLATFSDLIVEEYVSGYEVTNLIVSNKYTGKILVNEPLIISLKDVSNFTHEIFGIKEKYSGIRQYHLAEKVLPSATVEKIKEVSETIIRHLNMPNFVRIDYRIHDDEVYFLEINTNPAFGETSDVGKLCALRNIPFVDFVKLFIESCLP